MHKKMNLSMKLEEGKISSLTCRKIVQHLHCVLELGKTLLKGSLCHVCFVMVIGESLNLS